MPTVYNTPLPSRMERLQLLIDRELDRLEGGEGFLGAERARAIARLANAVARLERLKGVK